MTDIQMNGVLTVEEVGRILKISRTKAYEYVNGGKFPIIKIGRSIRIPAAPFFSWLNSFENSHSIQQVRGA